MAGKSGRPIHSKAWEHYKRTGVILPEHQAEIAAGMARSRERE